jgi:hypothetical protein
MNGGKRYNPNRLSRTQVLILSVWAPVSVAAGSVLTSFHQPFALPSGNISSLASPSPQGGWRVLHVVAADCGCSRKVAEYLVMRAPLKGITEEVLFIGARQEFTAHDRQFESQWRQVYRCRYGRLQQTDRQSD